MTLKLKPAEVRRLQRNLAGQVRKPKRNEDPPRTIKKLRAEVAMLRALLDHKQKIIDALNREIDTMRKKV